MSRLGFTLIEIVVVMALISTLVTLGAISLSTGQQVASTRSTSGLLLSDIRSQQIKAMVGDSEGTGVTSAYGVYLGSTSYTMFRGGSYDPLSSANFVVPLNNQLTLTSNLPNSQIVFLPRSGEISGYTSGLDSIFLTNSGASETVTFTFNRLGVVISNY